MESKRFYSEKVRRPTDKQLKQAADKFGFNITEQEFKDLQKYIDLNLEAYDALALIPDNLPAVKYPRTPGYFPDPADNKMNAWYVKCEIKGATSGKLSGKTVVIKDNICLAGVPMMNGCLALEGYIPDTDATVITRILDAGATILGKGNCENLCLSATSFTCAKGAVHNPHKQGYSSGGSSSGVAALVGAGEVDMGIGGDQGGSIRMPSSWSGCVGMKPTHGLVPYTGAMSMETTLDHLGPITANVTDNALMLEVLVGPDELDPRQYIPEGIYGDYLTNIKDGVKDLKIGIVKEGFGLTVSEKIVDEQVMKAAGYFKDLGAIVEEVSIPEHLIVRNAFLAVVAEGIYKNLAGSNGTTGGYKGLYLPNMIKAQAAWKSQADDLPLKIKQTMIQGDFLWNQYHGAFYAKGQNLARKYRQAFDMKLKDYNILIMPTVPFRALPHPVLPCTTEAYLKYGTGISSNTSVFNLTGHPALSLPIAKVDGLPIGMMLISKYYNEALIYKAAYAWEQAYNWKEQN